MKKRYQIAESILRPLNPAVIIILGIYTIIWGLWIANPFWSVFGQAQLYSAMATVAGEEVWGTVSVLTGLLIVRGALTTTFTNLQIGAFAGFFHWFLIAMFYFVGDFMNTGGITSLTFAVYAGVVWLNVRVNKKLYMTE